MVKCDRCGTINETGDRILVFENSTSNSDKELEVDLCAECKRSLWKFFTPLPIAAPTEKGEER